MLTKIRKILLIGSLIVVSLLYAEGETNGGNVESDIEQIIKDSIKEEEKQRKLREKEERAKQREEEKAKKEQEKQNKKNKDIETEIDNIVKEANEERGITSTTGVSNVNISSNTKENNTIVKTNTIKQVESVNHKNNNSTGKTQGINNSDPSISTNINEILIKNKQQKENKTNKVVIDKNKPVIIAEEREKEEKNQYSENLIKYIVTKDGKVLKDEHSTKIHPIASLTKVMNILVALDQVDKGNVNLEDNICFTPDIVNLGGSWLNAKVGDCYTLRDLLRTEIIYSANNAAYLVAKHVGKGNLNTFVELMNQKAKELGMVNTKFYTPAGLPTSMTGKGMDVSTAQDLYLLGKAAISDNRIREWASEQVLVFLNKNGEQVVYNNRNHLLGEYGIFGLKTGFHGLAGYNMIVTGKMGNIEVISVVLGHKSDIDRTNDQREEFKKLSEELISVYTAGNDMGIFKIKGAKKKKVKGILSEDVYQLKGTNYQFKVKDIKLKVTKEGLKEGDIIGKLEVISEGKVISEVDILSIENVKPLTFIGKILRFLTLGLL